MVLKKAGLLFVIVLVVFSLDFALALDDLMAIQGNVQQSGVNLASGDLQVVIFDAVSGGNLIYNSTTDFNGKISQGKYDVMLGNGTNELHLIYGKLYYLELYVKGTGDYEKFSFNGVDRQMFQSSIGMINGTSINVGEINGTHIIQNLILTGNVSTTGNLSIGNNLAVTGNATTGAGGWFKGMFDWVVNSVSSRYLSFNGTVLQFNESNLNSTFSLEGTRIGFNSTYNATYHGSINNASYLSTYNVTYSGAVSNASYLSTYNATYDALNGQNTSLWGEAKNKFNATYLTSSSANLTYLNFTPRGTVDFNGGWQGEGLSIVNGDLYAKTVYLYNISSLQVNNINTNGSLIPSINDSFNVGNYTSAWRYGYFSQDIYIGGDTVKKWLYNQTTPVFTQTLLNNTIALEGTRIGFNNTYNATYESTYNASYYKSGDSPTFATITATSGVVIKGDLQILNNSANLFKHIYGGTADGSDYLGLAISPAGTFWPHSAADERGAAIIMSGNERTYGSSNYAGDLELHAGTVATAEMTFYTGNASRMEIQYDGDFAVNVSTLFVQPSTGKVGIGTVTPSSTLHVVGNANISDGLNVTGNAQIVGMTTGILRVGPQQDKNSYNVELYSSYSNADMGGVRTPLGNLIRQSWVPRLIYIGTGNAIIINDTNNWVGIGTSSPTQLLDVRGAGNFSGTVYINNGTDVSALGGGVTSTIANNTYRKLSDTINKANISNSDWVTSSIANSTYSNITYNQTSAVFTMSLLNETISKEGLRIGFNNTYNASYDSGVKWQYNQTNWNVSGTNMYPQSLGYTVGIGTASPSKTLEVAYATSGILFNSTNTGSTALTYNLQNTNWGANQYIQKTQTGILIASNQFGFSALGDQTGLGNGVYYDSYGTDAFIISNITNGNPTLVARPATRQVIIGNTTAGAITNGALTVRGRTSVGNGTGQTTFIGGNPQLQVLTDAGTDASMGFWIAGTAAALIGQKAGDSTFYITNSYNSELLGQANVSITLKQTTGNVGIGTTAPPDKLSVVDSTNVSSLARLARGLQGSDSNLSIGFGYPYLHIGGAEYIGSTTDGPMQTIGFGYNDLTTTFQPAEIGIKMTNTNSYGKGDLVFATRDVITNTIPTERMRIDSFGKVGINTTTPTQTLEVKGNVNISGSAIVYGTISYRGDNNFQTAAGGNGIYMGSGTTITFYQANSVLRTRSSDSIQFWNYTNNEIMRLNAGGQVWMKGDVNFTGDLYDVHQRFLFNGTSHNFNVNNTLYVDSTNNKVGIGTITPTHTLNVVGNTNITGDLWLRGVNLSTSASGSPNSWLSTSTTIYNNTAGVKVGIGTTAPTHELNVVGSANITGTLYLNNTQIFTDTTGNMVFRL